jgi:hypothetical protein
MSIEVFAADSRFFKKINISKRIVGLTRQL